MNHSVTFLITELFMNKKLIIFGDFTHLYDINYHKCNKIVYSRFQFWDNLDILKWLVYLNKFDTFKILHFSSSKLNRLLFKFFIKIIKSFDLI